MAKHTPVTFLNSRGEVITNDPVVKAQMLLGISTPAGASDEEEIDTDPYNSLKGAELKTLAAERGVDIKGLKTVGEVRDALREADKEEESAGEDEDEDE